MTLTMLAMVVIGVRLVQQGAHAAFWSQSWLPLTLFTVVPVAAALGLGWLALSVARWLSGGR
jgi:hypothetical protein